MLSRLNFVFVAAFLMVAVLAAPLQAETIVLHDDFDDGVMDTLKWTTFVRNGATVTEVGDGTVGVMEFRKGDGSGANRGFLATVGEWIPANGAITVSGRFLSNDTSHFDVWTRAADYFDTDDEWNGVADSGLRFGMSPDNRALEGFEKLPATIWTAFGTKVYLPSGGSDKTWDFVLTDDGFNVSFTVTEVGNETNTNTFAATSNLSQAGEYHVLFTGHDIDLDEVTITQVPEPSTLALLATGLIGLLCYAWRKQK